MAKDKPYGQATPGQTTLIRDEPAKKTTVQPAATSPTVSAQTRETSRPGMTRPGEARRDSVPSASAMPFNQRNYMVMLIGIGVILAGFFIMTLDKEEFGFGFLGLTLGPLVVMSGFVIEFFAILYRPKNG